MWLLWKGVNVMKDLKLLDSEKMQDKALIFLFAQENHHRLVRFEWGANFRASEILILILCYIHSQFLQKIHPYLSRVASHQDLYFFSHNFTYIQ